MKLLPFSNTGLTTLAKSGLFSVGSCFLVSKGEPVIKLDMANIITIALCGALGYGALIGVVKGWQLVQGKTG